MIAELIYVVERAHRISQRPGGLGSDPTMGGGRLEGNTGYA
jgi:hypothetical protein